MGTTTHLDTASSPSEGALRGDKRPQYINGLSGQHLLTILVIATPIRRPDARVPQQRNPRLSL